MAIWKDDEGKLYDDMDGEALKLGIFPNNLKKLTSKELSLLEDSLKPTDADKIKLKIMELESSITQRRLRESVLGIDNGWLSGVDAEIAELRKQL